MSASHNRSKELTRKLQPHLPACKYNRPALCIDSVYWCLLITPPRSDERESNCVPMWEWCLQWTVAMLSTGPQLRLLQLVSCVALLLLLRGSSAKRDLKSACSTCRQITDDFTKVSERDHTSVMCCLSCYWRVKPNVGLTLVLNVFKCLQMTRVSSWFVSVPPCLCVFVFQGFDRTAKQNFGGGNTAWEERKLSKYETRWDAASCPVPLQDTVSFTKSRRNLIRAARGQRGTWDSDLQVGPWYMRCWRSQCCVNFILTYKYRMKNTFKSVYMK